MSQFIAPGYCIAEQPGSLDFQARMLFRDYRSPAARFFMQANADTPWLKPGQLMIVADPDDQKRSECYRYSGRESRQIIEPLPG